MKIFDPKNENGEPLLTAGMLEKAYQTMEITIPAEGSVTLSLAELGSEPANYDIVAAKVGSDDIIPESQIDDSGNLVIRFWYATDNMT